MKIISINKASIILLCSAISLAFMASSCGSDDGNIYSDTKTVTYAFKFEEQTAEYVTALIVYIDKMSVPQTVKYQGVPSWEISFSAPSGFSPYMNVVLVRKEDVTPSNFPVTLSYEAGIVNGEIYEPMSRSFTFDDLSEYNEFFVSPPDDAE